MRRAEIHVDSLLTQHLEKPESLNSSRQGTSNKEQALDWRMSCCKTHNDHCTQLDLFQGFVKGYYFKTLELSSGGKFLPAH